MTVQIINKYYTPTVRPRVWELQFEWKSQEDHNKWRVHTMSKLHPQHIPGWHPISFRSRFFSANSADIQWKRMSLTAREWRNWRVINLETGEIIEKVIAQCLWISRTKDIL